MMRQPDLVYWTTAVAMGVLIGVLGKVNSAGPARKLLCAGFLVIGVGLVGGALSGYSSSALVAMLWFATDTREDAMGLTRFIALGYALVLGSVALEIKRRVTQGR